MNHIKKGLQVIINPFILFMNRYLVLLWRKVNRSSNPRYWSNDELKKFAKLITGHVLNISGGNDADKEGQTYRAYFGNASSYSISNYDKSLNGTTENKLYLDLGSPLQADSDLVNKFDVVFSHTVLEHVYDIKTAIANMCLLSKDVVITVVPFLQSFHHDDQKFYPETFYHDYWRFSPYTLINLFNEHNFKTVYINWNDDPFGNIYIFQIATKYPDKWRKLIDSDFADERKGPGYSRNKLLGRTLQESRYEIITDL
jgi:hypothetical protein